MRPVLLLTILLFPFAMLTAQPCAVNDECAAGANGPQVINAGTGSQTCVPGCNTGATVGPFFNGNTCFDLFGATVWYSISPNGTSNIDITVTSTDLQNPQVAVFSTTDCNTFQQWGCDVGAGGTLTISQLGIPSSQTIFIAVADDLGAEGNFDICVELFTDDSACNVDNTLSATSTSMGSPLTGPYQPGETVQFCYDVNQYRKENCNWFQGIVPTFGNCWDASSFDGNGQPATTGLGTAGDGPGFWAWLPAGDVLYNDITGSLPPFTPVGGGWFFTLTDQHPNDPNQTYGDGDAGGLFDDPCELAGNGFTWQICFDLTAVDANSCSNSTNCEVSIKTYADGEIGIWDNVACTADQPTSLFPILDCCAPPIMDPLAAVSICSGETTSINPTSNQDPGTSYTWTVVADPAISGASAGSGTSINQTLTNSSNAPANVTYSLTPDNGSCAGTPMDIVVTVNTSPNATATPAAASICTGGTTSINLGADIAGTTLSWTVNNPAGITGASAGVGLTINQTLNNSTASPIDLTYTVTPTGPAPTLCQGSDISVVITVNPPFNIIIDPVTPVSCNGGTDGSATAAGSGGTAPYTYEWQTGGMTDTETGLSAGTYTLTVTDFNGCTSSTNVIIGQTSALTASATLLAQVVCNSESNGSATASGNGGTPNYIYLWDNNETTATANALDAGNHNVTITDDNGCQAVASINIPQPAAVAIPINLNSNINCNGGNDGSATANPNGGNGPYSYNWSSGENTATAINLVQGLNTVTVQDVNNCQATGSINITAPAALNIALAGSSDTNCASCNGSATIAVNGGTSPYLYLWDNGEITANPTSLCSGNNTVTVTDGNGCEQTFDVSINSSTALNFTGTNSQNLACNAVCDGTITVSTSGGQAPITYTWSANANGQNTAAISGLCAGTYNLTVSDIFGCTIFDSYTIIEPTALTAAALLNSNASCNGENDGSATATANGGTAPITFTWDSGTIGATATNLNAGNHNVTATDSNGCSTITTVTVAEPAILSISLNINNNVSCSGMSDGSATASSTGGTAPFVFTWENGTVGPMANNLNAGSHDVTVTDGNGCADIATINITESVVLSLNVSLNNNVNCNGGNDGSATATANGGSPPLTYIWDSGTVGNTANNLDAGIHQVTVLDVNNCTTTGTVQITAPTALALSLAITNQIPCFGENDGLITATAGGGTAPLSYNWSHNSTLNSPIANSLNAGNYSLTITDANDCSLASSINLGQPSELNLNLIANAGVLCNGDNNGIATATVAGGTGQSTIVWSTGFIGATANDLPAGNNTVTVTDANGCSETGAVNISTPAILTVSMSATDSNCQGNNGTVTATTGGGAAPYSYNWNVPGNTATLSNLPSGTYSVTVIDSNNCTKTGSATVNTPSPLSASLSSTPTNCHASLDGTATINVVGGALPYSYLWDNGELSQTAIFLGGGVDHYVTVTDNSGCTLVENIFVGRPDLLGAASLGTTPVSCFGDNDGTATILPSGGTAPYVYSWSNGQNTPTANGLSVGITYTVNITDANGCQFFASAFITGPTAALSATATAMDVSCFNGDDGYATISPTGGTPSYTVTWNNGTTGSTAFGLSVGVYSAIVTDATGCMTIATAAVGEPTIITADIAEVDIACYGDLNGSISITASGGGGAYTYSIDGSNYSPVPVFNDLAAGNYTVYVMDAASCEQAFSASVSQPAEIFVAVDPPSVLVELGDSTTLETQVNTTAPLTYNWTPADYLSCIDCPDPVVLPLLSTNYQVMVVDTNGCSASTFVSVQVDKNRNVFIPNVFTPNGDLVNDYFTVFGGKGVSNVQTLTVFNRWGEHVFENANFAPSDETAGWDGLFKGKRLNPGVFVYFAVVEFVDGVVIEYKGDVTIMK